MEYEYLLFVTLTSRIQLTDIYFFSFYNNNWRDEKKKDYSAHQNIIFLDETKRKLITKMDKCRKIVTINKSANLKRNFKMEKENDLKDFNR